MIYTVSIEKKTVRIVGDSELVRGNVEIDYLDATFDPEWDDMERVYCIFYDGTPEGTRMKMEEGRCEIPWERLENTDTVKLTFIGYDDDDEDNDRRIVTREMVTSFAVKEHGWLDGDDPAEPTPTAWAQMEQRIDALEKSGGAIPDTSLSEEGRPADAKAVGDALADKQPKGDYLTEIPPEYVTDSELEDKGYLTEHQSLDAYALKTELPTVPTKVSAFENDKGYLTEVPENVVTWDELLVTLDQVGVARPVASEAGELFTDEDGKIYVI